ncbi:hypothetical protein BJ875DRAFT_47915 [Amylocarpus encephaloides]|uniref:Uncharacterized protein n=1 Tax=Amylocarpus encephaloides TaxID=45428 RepID=A0A9P8C930_9HELO|nr:hypothetical protein BJ875DRAFT_47915 [Amylocarpus encephaloides]
MCFGPCCSPSCGGPTEPEKKQAPFLSLFFPLFLSLLKTEIHINLSARRVFQHQQSRRAGTFTADTGTPRFQPLTHPSLPPRYELQTDALPQSGRRQIGGGVGRDSTPLRRPTCRRVEGWEGTSCSFLPRSSSKCESSASVDEWAKGGRGRSFDRTGAWRERRGAFGC